MSQRYWTILVGQPIEAVTFVQNYVQLVLAEGILSLIDLPVLLHRGRAVTSGSPEYSDLLCSQIGRTVTACSFVADDHFSVATGEVLLRQSLRAADRIDVEMIIYQSKRVGGAWWVW